MGPDIDHLPAAASGLVMGSALALAAGVAATRTVRRVRIGAGGAAAVATVTGCGPTGWSTLLDHRWLVEYTTADGRTCTGVGLPPSREKAPPEGTQLTVYHDQRHPRSAQQVRWEWERILLTGLIGVPACVLFALSNVAMVVAVLAGRGTGVARWAAWTGRGAEHLGQDVVPVLGLIVAAVLVAGSHLDWRRPWASPLVRFAAVLAACCAGYLLIGGMPLLVMVLPLALDGTDAKILDR